MLTSKRPYFIRCWYDWICDNHLTPYIIINTQSPHVQVPSSYIENNRLVLNIAPEAVNDFSLTNQVLRFKADFDPPVGIAQIILPIHSIIAIYADENKQGIYLDETELGSTPNPDEVPPKTAPKFTVIDS